MALVPALSWPFVFLGPPGVGRAACLLACSLNTEGEKLTGDKRWVPLLSDPQSTAAGASEARLLLWRQPGPLLFSPSEAA